jgi:tetratricopeptide (TPR) repeat protein
MTVGDLARIRRIVELVHDLAPEERGPVLERECAGDGALRAEVVALLGAAEAAPEFLARAGSLPAAGELVAAAGELVSDTRIGGFRLIARIATGGMGTVWEAEQDSPRRRVALKVLRFAGLSPEATRRFRHEAEILARLRHPNIAQVFAAGVHALPGGESLPWYALEHVEGARALTEFVAERGLALPARLELFTRLCDAVQHGHERGVIHRDLKPSNVLVDRSGQLKVIDFGVARVREPGAERASLRTRTGSVIGTLQYMSPEQVAGDSDGIDTRSDVYALGVMLYELVTGAPPYDLEGLPLARAALVLTQHAPRRPSSLVPRLSADVDAIVLEALAKERERRYPSAAALADDIRRHARGEPVLARTPSAAYQLRVFARRHRAATAAAGGILAAALGAAGVSLHYAWQARAAQGLATRRFEEVRGLARSVLFELHDSIENLPGATEARRKLAHTALGYLDALEREARDDPGLLEEIAEGRLRLGLVLGAPGHASLGEHEAGARELERALATSERLIAVRPDGRAKLVRARALVALGNFERAAGRLERALELCARGEEEAASIARLDAGDPAAAMQVSSARVQRAKVLALLGRTEEARALLLAEIPELGRQRERWPAAIEPLHAAMVARVDLGILLLRGARPAEALVALAEALALAEERLRLAPTDAQASGDLALALTWRARARADGGDPAAALADHERAVRLFRELVARDPDDSTAAQDLAFACEQFGAARQAAGDLEGALEALTEARELARGLVEGGRAGFDERLALANGEQAVAEVLRALGQADEAHGARSRALELLRELEAEEPESLDVARQLGTALMRTADREREAGRLDEALVLYDQAGQRIERAAARDPGHAWARRMVMVTHCWRGVAHKAAAEASVGPLRSAHLEEAARAFEAALAEEPELARAGFLQPGDERAVELVRADLEACRRAQAEPSAP